MVLPICTLAAGERPGPVEQRWSAKDVKWRSIKDAVLVFYYHLLEIKDLALPSLQTRVDEDSKDGKAVRVIRVWSSLEGENLPTRLCRTLKKCIKCGDFVPVYAG